MQKVIQKHNIFLFFSIGFDYIENQRANSEGTDANLKIKMFYDPLGQLIKTINPSNTFREVKYQPWTSKNYDEEDLIPNGPHYDTPTEMLSDAFGRLIEVTEYANKQRSPIQTVYKYDLSGNLIEVIDATKKNENRRHMIYDLFGQKLRSIEPNTGTRHYFYDENGNLIYRRDNKEQWVKYEYDDLDRLIRKSYITPDGPNVVEANLYDEGEGSNLIGRLSKVKDLSGNMTYSYDQRGRIIRKIRRLDGLDKEYISDFTYDSLDRLTAVTYPDKQRTQVTFNYDKANHLESIPGYVQHIAYNAKSQRKRILYDNGVKTQYVYDPHTFWLKDLNTTSKDGTQGDLAHRNYQYDKVGNVISIEDQNHPTGDVVYEYDALYQLTNAHSQGEIPYHITYDYDVIGNLIQKSDLDSNELNYAKDGKPHTLNQYGTVILTYDKNGNLEHTPGMQLQWDYEDRLVGIKRSDGISADYVYDASGVRTKKHVKHNEGEYAVYYIDKYLEIREDKELLSIFIDETRAASVDEEGKVIFHHGDHLGSIGFQTDLVGKEKQNPYIYGPYGKTLRGPPEDSRSHGSLNTPSKFLNSFQFNGKERDGESGFIYYGNRYYDPKTGRWISPDPLSTHLPSTTLEEPTLLNLYSYTRNNPVYFIDPDGLGAWASIKSGAAKVGNFAVGLGEGAYQFGKETVKGVVHVARHPIQTIKALPSAIKQSAVDAYDTYANLGSNLRIVGDSNSRELGGAVSYAAAHGVPAYYGGKGLVAGGRKVLGSLPSRVVRSNIKAKIALLKGEGVVRYAVGKAKTSINKTYQMALNPDLYIQAVVKKYRINLKGSGQRITVKFNPNLNAANPGISRAKSPTTIEIGPAAMVDEATLARAC